MRITIKKLTTITAAFALASGATFSLSGCFGNPLEDALKGGAGNILKEVTGADVEIGSNSIPESFPTQVPLIRGEIEFGGSVTVDKGKVWTVQVRSNDPAAFDQIQLQMSAAGFEEKFSTEGDQVMASFEGHGYGLIVNIDKSDGNIGITYVVTELGDE